MAAPSVPFAKAADQMRLRQLKLENSMVPEAGRVMFCRGRRVISYGDVTRLAEFRYIPNAADTVCISAADFDDVKAWLS